VARLERNKRVDLIVRALSHLPAHLRLIVVGDGSHRRAIEREAEQLGVRDRVTFAGAVSDEQLVDLYRHALCLAYVPFDEDYGLATLEGFLAEKPVVTARDSGGTLEFVRHDENGFVVDPDADAIASAVAELDANRRRAAALGANGHAVAAAISWDSVIERLVSHD
jgi:glycosyltransferase involved in cell wall biosynthesis